tara:strand:+ start:337 stop:960 length:624 start_codon:yes stop_codon:yes gene_type:complete
MKNLVVLLFLLQVHSFCFAQILSDVDEVYPFSEDLAAVKKGNEWGFINKKGALVISYRSDLDLKDNFSEKGKIGNKWHPAFKDDRCLIKKTINEVNYYGYIDSKGNEIIHPQYLNATNFENGFALIIAPSKDVIGFNEILKKDIISSNIEEFVINTLGEKVRYLENPINYDSSKRKSKLPPVFHSKFIGARLVAVQKKDMKWDIYEF